MKREGRQHGMVRNYKNSPINKPINQFQTPPTAGIFTRVSTKPTNHSKYTGKSRCGSIPSYKSKDKAKGHHKVKSFDVGMNHRLVSWRVVDDKGYHGVNYVGVSASDVLGHLSNYYHNYEDEDEDYDVEEDEHVYDRDHDVSIGLGDELVTRSCAVVEEEEEIVYGSKEIDIDEVVHDDEAVDDDGADEDEDDDMGFCDVGFVIQQLDGDEGWCLVGELGGD